MPIRDDVLILSKALAYLAQGLLTQVSGTASVIGLGLCLYIIARHYIGDQFMPILILDLVAPWLALLAVGCVAVTLLSPLRYYLMIFPALACVGLCLPYLPSFVPRPAPPIRSLKVMTINVGGVHQNGYCVLNQLNEAQPHIVALQENYQPTSLIANSDYPYVAVDGHLTILSRYPIVAQRTLGYAVEDGLAYGLEAMVEVEGTVIQVVSAYVHKPKLHLSQLAVRRKMRDTTLNALLHTAQTAQHPLLIMGDFNMSDLSSDYQHLSDHLQDGWRGVGYGLGFTAPNIRLLPPYARVDYVWHSDHFKAVHAQTRQTTCGDHLPLEVGFTLS